MKRLTLLFLMLTTALFAELDWVPYETALSSAQKENKIVMIMLSQEGCDACWYMNDIVFENDDMIDEIGMDFVPVHYDVKEDEVPKQFSYIGTPTFYFLNAKGEKIKRLNGAYNVKDFTEHIRDVKATVKK